MIGREKRGIELDLLDVAMAGDRPIGAEHAVRAKVNRCLAPQTLEIAWCHPQLEQARLGNVDLLDRQAIQLGLQFSNLG
jgi:hypothetical protein